jgi:hypothetical protein
MKRFLLIAGLLLSSSASHALSQTFNSCTGCPDYLGTGGGGGGSSSLQVTSSGVQVTSPTSSINFYSGDFSLNSVNTSTAQVYLNPATTDFIHNQSTRQTPAVLNIDSGTFGTSIIASTEILKTNNQFGGNLQFWNSGNNNSQIQFFTDNGAGNIGSINLLNTGYMRFIDDTGGPFSLQTQDTERIRINYAGSVDVITSATVQGAGGLGVTYNINAGSTTGSGLSTCGDSTHALGWTSGTNQFSCQSVTGSATPGGVSTNVQYNNGGTFSGSSLFQFNGTSTSILTPLLVATTAQITAFQVSSNTTGIPLMGVSSSPVSNPSDFLLTLASPTVTPSLIFGVQFNGHVISSGTIPSVSACGTSPSMDSNSTDFAGKINVGSVTATSCVLTFANPFLNSPICIVSDDSTGVNADISSISNTSVTFGFSVSLANGHVWYICVGAKG